MLTAATSTLATNATGIALVVLVLLLVWWSITRSPRVDHVSWAEFERQFAEYVAGHEGSAEPQARDGYRADDGPPRHDAPSARRPD